MMSTKQIVVDQDLHRKFHQDCVKKGVTMRSATERLIKDALGDVPVTEEIQAEMHEDSAAGGPMLRYGNQEDVGPEILKSRDVKVHGSNKSNW